MLRREESNKFGETSNKKREEKRAANVQRSRSEKARKNFTTVEMIPWKNRLVKSNCRIPRGTDSNTIE